MMVGERIDTTRATLSKISDRGTVFGTTVDKNSRASSRLGSIRFPLSRDLKNIVPYSSRASDSPLIRACSTKDRGNMA